MADAFDLIDAPPKDAFDMADAQPKPDAFDTVAPASGGDAFDAVAPADNPTFLDTMSDAARGAIGQVLTAIHADKLAEPFRQYGNTIEATTLPQKLGRIAGSAIPVVASAGAGVPAAVVAGGLQGVGAAREDAQAHNATPGQSAVNQLVGGVTGGAMALIPGAKAAGSPIVEGLVKPVVSGAALNVLANAAQNAVAKATYDPQRDVTAGTGDAALAGAVLPAAIHTVKAGARAIRGPEAAQPIPQGFQLETGGGPQEPAATAGGADRPGQERPSEARDQRSAVRGQQDQTGQPISPPETANVQPPPEAAPVASKAPADYRLPPDLAQANVTLKNFAGRPSWRLGFASQLDKALYQIAQAQANPRANDLANRLIQHVEQTTDLSREEIVQNAQNIRRALRDHVATEAKRDASLSTTTLPKQEIERIAPEPSEPGAQREPLGKVVNATAGDVLVDKSGQPHRVVYRSAVGDFITVENAQGQRTNLEKASGWSRASADDVAKLPADDRVPVQVGAAWELRKPGTQNAETIRSNQGQVDETRSASQTGESPRSGDLQQPAPEEPGGTAQRQPEEITSPQLKQLHAERERLREAAAEAAGMDTMYSARGGKNAQSAAGDARWNQIAADIQRNDAAIEAERNRLGLPPEWADETNDAIEPETTTPLDLTGTPFDVELPTTGKPTRGDFQSLETGNPPDKAVGAAHPSDEGFIGEKSGIKRATMDVEMQQRGIEPRGDVERRAWEQSLADAKERLRVDPDAARKLVADLANNPRAIDDTEVAVLNIRQQELQQAHAAAAEATHRGTPQEREAAALSHAALTDQLAELYHAVEGARTGTGRGLSAMRMMLAEDYSLAKMEQDRRAANRGARLTDKQQAETEQSQQAIEQAQQKLEEHEQRQADRQAQNVVNRIRGEVERGGAPSRDDVIARIELARQENPEAGLNHNLLMELARAHIRAGVKEMVPLVEALRKDLKPYFGDVPAKQIRDAMTNYGKVRYPSKEAVEVKLREMKEQMRLASAIEDANSGKAPARSGWQRDKPTEATRLMQNELRQIIRDHPELKQQSPEQQMATALQLFKTRTTNQISDLIRRMAAGDFKPRQPRDIQLDAEGMRLQARLEEVKENWRVAVEKDRLANLTPAQKFGRAFVNWERAFKLSSPVVFGKLSAAAVTRMAQTGVEEGITSVLAKAPGFSKVAQNAPRYGGASVQAEAKAYTAAVMQGMKDAVEVARSGKSVLDRVYGRKMDLGKEWSGFFGQLHGALKAPVKRAEFERSFQKRVEFALRNGIDASDPAVQAKIASEAYVDANRAIFMQRNVVSDSWNNLISMLEKSKKYPVAGEVGARVARFLAPVVTVPTNIVGETATMATGTITSSARLLWAMRNGMESLRPTEATLAGLKPHERAARIFEAQKQSDLIMRNMAKGSIGLALMALGFLNPQGAGGYYQPGEKRKPGDVKAGGFRVYGWDVPRWLTHAPAFEAIQIGATMRRVLEHHTKQDPDGPGIPLSAWAAAMGLVQEIPIIDESARLGEAASNPGKFFGDMAVNTIVPQAVQFAARQTDQRDGETIKRNPTNTVEYLKTGIPGLRQTVPEKHVKMRIIR